VSDRNSEAESDVTIKNKGKGKAISAPSSPKSVASTGQSRLSIFMCTLPKCLAAFFTAVSDREDTVKDVASLGNCKYNSPFDSRSLLTRTSADTVKITAPTARAVRRRVIRLGPLVVTRFKKPVAWPPQPHDLATAMYLLPPKTTFWVYGTRVVDIHVNPTKYGSTGFFSLGLCNKTFNEWEACDDDECWSDHYPLEPDIIRWMAQNGAEEFLFTYLLVFWPYVAPPANHALCRRNYRDVHFRDLSVPPKLNRIG
jgi:hypothetical protein